MRCSICNPRHLVGMAALAAVILMGSTNVFAQDCYCLQDVSLPQASCSFFGYEWYCEPEPMMEPEPTDDDANKAHLYWYYNYGPGATQEDECCEEKKEIAKKESEQSQLGITQSTQDRNSNTNTKFLRNIGIQNRTGLGTGGSGGPNLTTSTGTPGSVRIQGLAAGEVGSKFGVWFNPSYSWLESERTDSAYDGNSGLVIGGVDYILSQQAVVGLTLGWEKSDLDTTFNRGTFENDGFSIGPYVGFQFNDYLSVDALLIWSQLNNDVERNSTLGSLNGSYDSDRTMFGANLNYFRLVNQWNLTATLGYLYSDEKEDAYTESGDFENQVADGSVHVGQVRIGARAGYSLDRYEPYVSLTYVNDYTRTLDTGDKDEMEGILGVNYYASDRFTCGFEARNSFFRSDFTNTELMINLRYAF
jgi:outer membrane autotransporter protein